MQRATTPEGAFTSILDLLKLVYETSKAQARYLAEVAASIANAVGALVNDEPIRAPLVFVEYLSSSGVELSNSVQDWQMLNQSVPQNNGRSVTHRGDDVPICAVVPFTMDCDSDQSHTVEFHVVNALGSVVMVGVTAVAYDPTDWRQEGDLPSSTEHGWMWRSEHGACLHDSDFRSWEGQEGYETGDLVRLELAAGTLTAYKLGAGSSEWSKLGTLADGLTGSFRWCVELQQRGDTLNISGDMEIKQDDTLQPDDKNDDDTKDENPSPPMVDNFQLAGEGEDVSQLPTPRHPCASLLPLIYGLLVGGAGLFFIATFAARLGPQSTRLWLVSALGSVVLKILVVEPARIFASTALLNVAERCCADRLKLARSRKGDDQTGNVGAEVGTNAITSMDWPG
eukprot:COSAG02_NODE_2600_length_8448_cov_43.599473_7_plen_397_part_00